MNLWHMYMRTNTFSAGTLTSEDDPSSLGNATNERENKLGEWQALWPGDMIPGELGLEYGSALPIVAEAVLIVDPPYLVKSRTNVPSDHGAHAVNA